RSVRLPVRWCRRSLRCPQGRRTSPSDRTGSVLLHRGKVRRSFYQEGVVFLEFADLLAQSQQLGAFGRFQGFVSLGLGGGDPAPFEFDPFAQQTLVQAEFAGDFCDGATRIDHTVSGLDLVLGRKRPTFAGRHVDILPAGPVVPPTRCPLSWGNPKWFVEEPEGTLTWDGSRTTRRSSAGTRSRCIARPTVPAPTRRWLRTWVSAARRYGPGSARTTRLAEARRTAEPASKPQPRSWRACERRTPGCAARRRNGSSNGRSCAGQPLILRRR